jgi:diamine N-acetyltransferase
MSNKVKLKKVTANNWEGVVQIELNAGQEGPVPSNLYSIAGAQFDPDACPRRVYAWKRLVSFLMYDVQKTKGKAQIFSIYRFMIDRKHQGKDYGRAALKKALEEIRAILGVGRISIRHTPENPVAKPFYDRLGFVETGLDCDGEVIAVLKL